MHRRLQRARGLEHFDLAVGAWATEIGRKPGMRLLTEIAELADQPPLLTLSLLALAGGAVTKDRRLTVTGNRMLRAFAGATLTKMVLKSLVSRSRPSALLDRGVHRARLRGPRGRLWESFPSGHTAGGIALARAIGRAYPQQEGRLVSLALALGALKIFKGDHYPSDVLAGLVLGLVTEKILR